MIPHVLFSFFLLLLLLLLLQQIHTQCSDAILRVFIYVFHYFLFSFCVCVAFFLRSPRLFRLFFAFHYVILIVICYVCRNVLFNYGYMMERRRQPNSLITIVLVSCRKSTLQCIMRLCTRLTILGKSYSIWCELKTIIFGKCKSAHAFFDLFVYCYLCQCFLYGKGFNFIWK